MSLFSEYLNQYIAEMGSTVYQIAKKGNVDRSSLHKIVNGERVPSPQFFNKLCTLLMLTPKEKEELDELYGIAHIGDRVYFRRKKVLELIEEMAGIGQLPSMAAQESENGKRVDPLPGGMTLLKGKIPVSNGVIGILTDAFSFETIPKIFIMIPFRQNFAFNLLYNLYMNTEKKVDIHHVVCLEKENRSVSSVVNNLERLKNILSFALTGKGGYYPKYYYSEDTSEEHLISVMPYIIMTNRYVITLSEDFQTAILYDNKDVLELYKNRLKAMYAELNPMLSFGEAAQDIYDWDLSLKHKWIIEPHPCIAEYMTPALIDALVRQDIPDREKLTAFGWDFYKRAQEESRIRGGGPVSIFTLKALEVFVKTGKLEFPDTIMRRMTLVERHRILMQMKRDLLAGKRQHLAVNEEKCRLPENMELIIDRDDEVAFRNLNPNRNMMITVRLCEASVAEAFQDFVNYLMKSDMVLTESELIAVIDGYLENK